MEFLANYGLFLAKALTVVISVLAVAFGIVVLSMRNKTHDGEEMQITKLNDKYDSMKHALEAAVLTKQGLKKKEKELKAERKARDKDTDPPERSRVFVVEFKGDMRASAVTSLRQEIDAILTTADKTDEVVVRLESPGGVVHGYGLAASQLNRLRQREIPLTACVDKVAASGGYLMACVADRIVAAPFAIIGSIGVVAQIPNFHRILKKNDVDFEQFTAGEFKRTVTMFGETTDSAREKVNEEIQETHALFKNYITDRRPGLDIDTVSTGEHWFGSQALDLNLVDEISTSDDYLLAKSKDADLFKIEFKTRKSFFEKIFSLSPGSQLTAAWLARALPGSDLRDLALQSGGMPSHVTPQFGQDTAMGPLFYASMVDQFPTHSSMDTTQPIATGSRRDSNGQQA